MCDIKTDFSSIDPFDEHVDHSMRMIVIERSSLLSILTLTLLIRQSTDAVAGRCYLCSQHTLAECAGHTRSNASISSTALRYYTEPCNGQCVFFRNGNQSVVRGCSWTYGHMQSKPTGWHEITPGTLAYFCDSPLCNNGTFDDPLTSTTPADITRNQFQLPLEQLFAMADNQPARLLLSKSSASCRRVAKLETLVHLDFRSTSLASAAAMLRVYSALQRLWRISRSNVCFELHSPMRLELHRFPKSERSES